ncbi:IS1249 family transposase [Actinotignum urinale]|nr:IS1249 family transposase [Actinotignum urinale]MDY5159791.1 IS1249 family transposase [Actinotignum urinale]
MNRPFCFFCQVPMVKNGHHPSGVQRWKCAKCDTQKTHRIDTSAKDLNMFISWLLGNTTMAQMPGKGRTFRRKTRKFWDIWPLSPVVDEKFGVIYLDGIHLGRKAVVLIARNDEHVLGWYVARNERTVAWKALLERIAAPDVVVCDGGSGLKTALAKCWSSSRVQRCTFHVFNQIKTATTMRPKLPASKEMYQLGKQLIRVKTPSQASEWLTKWGNWYTKYAEFLDEKSYDENGTWRYTHERVRSARNRVHKLIKQGTLFTYLDPDLTGYLGVLPAMNNKIEGATNATLRQMLFQHRGMSLARRIKAIFWHCYMHSPNPLPVAQILKVMPTDASIERVYQQIRQVPQIQDLPQWGDKITWADLHHTTPWTNAWD